MNENAHRSLADGSSGAQTVFISYAHEDAMWADWITTTLEAHGYTVICDRWDFGYGSNFVLEMDRALKKSDHVLALLSPEYFFSQLTQPEWAAAFARDPTGEKRTLIPVRIKDCVPEGLLSQVKYVDVVGQDERAATRRLLIAVGGEREEPDRPVAFPGQAHEGPPTGPGVQLESIIPEGYPAPEEGFLDVVERGTTSLGAGTVAAGDFVALLEHLTDCNKAHAAEFRSLGGGPGRSDVSRFKQVARSAAGDMREFARGAESALHDMTVGWERGFGAWTRTIEMLEDFGDVDRELLEQNHESIDSIIAAVSPTRQQVVVLRDSVARLPRLEGAFVVARNRVVIVLEASIRLLDRVGELASDTRRASQHALDTLQ